MRCHAAWGVACRAVSRGVGCGVSCGVTRHGVRCVARCHAVWGAACRAVLCVTLTLCVGGGRRSWMCDRVVSLSRCMGLGGHVCERARAFVDGRACCVAVTLRGLGWACTWVGARGGCACVQARVPVVPPLCCTRGCTSCCPPLMPPRCKPNHEPNKINKKATHRVRGVDRTKVVCEWCPGDVRTACRSEWGTA
jgi:hypothetical protein